VDNLKLKVPKALIIAAQHIIFFQKTNFYIMVCIMLFQPKVEQELW